MNGNQRKLAAGARARSWRGRLSALNDRLAKALMFLSCAIMLAMVLHIVADVMARYLFNQPLAGTIEVVSNWYMVGVAFLPLAYVQWHREHLIVELFTQNSSARTLRLMDGIVYAGCLAVLFIYIIETTNSAISKTRIGEAIETPWFEVTVWPTRWFLPVGLGAMAICMLVQILTGPRYEDHSSPVSHDSV